MRQNGSIMEIFHNFFNNSENEIIWEVVLAAEKNGIWLKKPWRS
jgi:hypothetical protein